MPMKPSALRGALTSGTLPARLLHTLFVFIATSLMFIIAILSFLFTLFFKFIMPAPAPSTHRRRGGERHVTFLEPSVVIKVPTPPRTPARLDHPTPTPASTTTTLSLTTTPHDLEPATPDVAEDPFRALSRICGFLASNSALAWRREELAATPPLAGLEPYLAAVREDLARIEEMGEEDEDEDGSESESEEGDSHDDAGSEEGKDAEEGLTVAVAGDSEVLLGDREDTGASAGTRASEGPEVGAGKVAAVVVGAGTGASADAQAEPDLVPDHCRTTRASPPPLPPSQLPTQPLSPDTSSVTVTATSTPTPGSTPPTPPPEPTAQNTASPKNTDTTPIATPSTSRRPPPPLPPQTTSTTKRPPPPPPPVITTTPPPTPAPAPTPLANPGPRKRKDAVLQATRPTTITGPEGLRVLSAAEAAAAATTTTTTTTIGATTAGTIGLREDPTKKATAPDALFSRVADLGTGLLEGTVRERGAALWAALSRGRGAPSEVPVPSMPRTRFATGAAERG